MRHTEIDRLIANLAAKQYGAFSRQQAFDFGASERFVARRLAAKDWLRPVPAVYVLPQSVGSWRRQCKIAELSVDGSAVACRTAAALHGLSEFRPGAIELVAPINTPCRHPTAIVHRFAGAKLTVVDGIRVTSIPQTLFDTAMFVDPWKLERAMDDAILAKKVTVAQLAERLTFYAESRRPGLPKIRPLVVERLEDGWVPAESELEAILFTTLGALSSRPTIVRQAPLPWRSSRPGRVDAYLPAHRLIIEADGRRWHTRVKDFDRDQWRNNEAVAHGHRVMRFTWVHLHDFAPDVLDVISRTISPSTAA